MVKIMEKYLGIYSNSSITEVMEYSFEDDSLNGIDYELKNTIEDLEEVKTKAKFLHIYEAQTNDFDITTYKYLTTKAIK